MKFASKFALALTVGVSLTGCQAIFGPRTAHVESADAAQIAAADANPALDLGRQLLKAGRIAQAIGLLRVAQRDPSSMAEASNALGVAYAKLGRHDLADRYFRMALSLEPGDARFAANMLRLQHDYDLALRRNEEEAQLALRAEDDRRLAEAQARAVPEPGQIERVSRGQVQIHTQPQPEAVAPRVGVMAMKAGTKLPGLPETGAQSAAVTKPVATEKVAPRNGPVTVQFGQRVRVPAKAESQDQAYPVRVYIGA